MIYIHPPEIEDQDGYAVISSVIETGTEKETLWYKFSEKYKKYLVTENLDAFLVGVLFLALRTGNDIELGAPASARLIYTLNHYLIPAMTLANPEFRPIKIFAKKLNYNNLNAAKVAGTGMSCGIDSFATYIEHLEEEQPYKIEYLTFFNVGSHLDFGGEKSRTIYEKRLEAVINFAAEENLDVISVDSNLSEILKMNFQQTHSLRSISCVLHLQKLFQNYYYSTAYRLDHFELNPKDTSDYDTLNLQMLSTESTTFFPAAAQYSRVERTLLVANYPGSFQTLDVCTDPPMNSSYLNCSACYKCLRTQLTLDLAGKLQEYEKVFNLEIYKREKEKYIGSLLSKKKRSVLDKEVLKYMKEMRHRFSIGTYFYTTGAWWSSYTGALKKKLKRQLVRFKK